MKHVNLETRERRISQAQAVGKWGMRAGFAGVVATAVIYGFAQGGEQRPNLPPPVVGEVLRYDEMAMVASAAVLLLSATAGTYEHQAQHRVDNYVETSIESHEDKDWRKLGQEFIALTDQLQPAHDDEF